MTQLVLSHVVQNILSELGQVPPDVGLFTATGGSTTTFVAGTSTTGFGALENQPEQDAFKNYLAIVVRDAGGSNAAPENEWGIVSAYADGTWTGTLATLTTAIASGDTIMLAKQDKFPLQQIIFAVNKGLQSLGDLPENADESLITVSDNNEYSVPVTVKRGLKQVWVEVETDYWVEVTNWRVEKTGVNTASRLHIPFQSAGLTIRLVGDGVHPVVSTYSSKINEYVHPEVVTAASIVKLLEWYNRQDVNQTADSYYLALQEQYRKEILPVALARHPIQRNRKGGRFFSLGNKDNRRSRYSGQLLDA